MRRGALLLRNRVAVVAAAVFNLVGADVHQLLGNVRRDEASGEDLRVGVDEAGAGFAAVVLEDEDVLHLPHPGDFRVRCW